MSEGFKPQESIQPKESFAIQKDAVIAYLTKKLAKEKGTLESILSYRERYANKTPLAPTGPIPAEVWADGGSDLSDWKVEMGQSRQAELEDLEHQDDELELRHLDDEIQDLKQSLETISEMTDLENESSEDVRAFEYILEEMKTSKS